MQLGCRETVLIFGSYVRVFFCAAVDEAGVSEAMEDGQIKEARLTIERLSRKYLVC